MNAHQFIFPPPPPPPPSIQATSSQVNHAGPPNGHKYGHNNRGNRGDRGYRGSRGSRGRGQSASKRGLRGADFGASSVPAPPSYTQQNNNPFSPHDAYKPPTNKPGSSYPLPEYPPVQQPQYPTNFSNYGRSAPTFPAASIASPSPVPEYYNNNTPGQLQFHSGQPQNTPYNYSSRNQNTSHYPHGPQQYSSTPSRPEHSNNPQLMGPPLRMGFNNVYSAANQQPPSPSQTLPSRANPLQHGTRPFMRPSFPTNPPGISSSTRHNSPNPFPDHRSRGQRRHNDVSGGQRRFNTKTQVAPAVPSFGNPLPVKPPAPQEMARRPKKKKRRHNQLGLTPKTLEHESSEEEENDVDEETKLAVAVGLPDSARELLQFSYRGRTSTLQSSSEIAAWLEERKKRFPTKARREEQKESQRQLQEKQHAATQLLIEARAKQRADAKEKKKRNIDVFPGGSGMKEQKVEPQKTDKEVSVVPNDAAAKAKLKVEKLRKRLEKEERRVAKAEAKASRMKVKTNDNNPESLASGTSAVVNKRKRSESIKSEKAEEAQEINPEVVAPRETESAIAPQRDHKICIKNEEIKTESTHAELLSLEYNAHVPSNTTHDPLTPTSQPSISEANYPEPGQNSIQPAAQPLTRLSSSAQPHDQMSNLVEQHGFNIDQSVPSDISVSSSSSSSLSLSTDSEDESTSSDGSTTSSSPSRPESRSIECTQPHQMPAPRRRQSRIVCRHFLQNGCCRKGDRCRFRHELPERGSRPEKRKQGKREGKKQRIGLFQRLMEQEKQKQKEEEDDEEEEKKAKLEPGQEKHNLELEVLGAGTGTGSVQTESAKERDDTPA